MQTEPPALAGFRIVPQLGVADAGAALAELQSVFGFEVSPGSQRAGRQGQWIDVHETAGALSHGVIDHLALRALDTDRAGRLVQARGGAVDRDVTPDGPLEIAQFWQNGVRYQFFQGPSGARIELCSLLPTPLGLPEELDAVLAGHDHIGLSCRDIAASRAFYAGLGLTEVFATTLATAAGAVPVCFMRRNGYTVELYSPPEVRDGQRLLHAQGLWQGLRFEGIGRTGTLWGPDGERIALAA